MKKSLLLALLAAAIFAGCAAKEEPMVMEETTMDVTVSTSTATEPGM